MVDDENEEEYHFSELGGEGLSEPAGNVYTAAPSENKTTFSKKNLMILIGVIIAVLFITKLAGVFFSSREKVEPQQPTQQVNKPVATTPTVHQETSQLVDSNKINQIIAAQTAAREKALTKLTQQINTLNNSIRSVQNEVRRVHFAVDELTNDVDLQQQKINALTRKREAKKAPKVVEQPAVVKRPVYFLKAAIPGRAWVQRVGNGATLTVTYGSNIPGYGWVKEINTQRGVITTSSGQLVTFSANER